MASRSGTKKTAPKKTVTSKRTVKKAQRKQATKKVAAKTKRPVGIIWMQTKAGWQAEKGVDGTTLAHWMAPEYLKDSPSTVEAGTTVGEMCREMGIAEATFSRWNKVNAGMGVSEIRRLKQPEDENGKLRCLSLI